MSAYVIVIDGWEYMAYTAEGEWWLDPLDPNAPEVYDNGAIMEAVGEARRRSANDETL
jgi:hypothetical protein